LFDINVLDIILLLEDPFINTGVLVPERNVDEVILLPELAINRKPLLELEAPEEFTIILLFDVYTYIP